MVNLYIKNQQQLLTNSINNAKNSWLKGNYRYINIANRQASKFLTSAKENPSVSKIIEQNIVEKQGNLLDQSLWGKLKETCQIENEQYQELFKKTYKNTANTREKLIQKNRFSLDKVKPKMTKLQKFLFKYLDF